jgi:hypothetical protein
VADLYFKMILKANNNKRKSKLNNKISLKNNKNQNKAHKVITK